METVSLTGGLLSMAKMLDRGSRIKLMFLTDAVAVLGTAEMLPSLSSTQQPFRFVEIDQGDESKLRNVIQSFADRSHRDQGSIVRDRAW